MSLYDGDQEHGVEDLITNQPVVIDNGTGSVKAGFAGDDRPTCVIRNYVGVPKHEKCMVRSLDGDHFVGKKVRCVHLVIVCRQASREHH